MNKKFIISLFALSPLLLGTFAAAQNRYAERWELGGQTGGMIVESDSKIDTQHLFGGGRVGYYLDNDLEIEAAVLAGEGDVKNNGRDSDLLLSTIGVDYNFCDDDSLRPFVSGGVGVLTEDGPSPANTGRVVLPLGGGVKWMIDENLALRLDGRVVFDTQGGGETMKGTYTIGASWLFDGPDNATEVPSREERRSEKMVMPEAAKVLERDKHVSIDLEVQFDFDRSNIKPQFEPRLNEFATFMKQHPNTVAEIEGHTDSIGTKHYNDRLSMRRATAVRNYLVAQGGISVVRLNAKGYGFSRPIADNETEEGRAKNRRVMGTVRSEQ